MSLHTLYTSKVICFDTQFFLKYIFSISSVLSVKLDMLKMSKSCLTRITFVFFFANFPLDSSTNMSYKEGSICLVCLLINNQSWNVSPHTVHFISHRFWHSILSQVYIFNEFCSICEVRHAQNVEILSHKNHICDFFANFPLDSSSNTSFKFRQTLHCMYLSH